MPHTKQTVFHGLAEKSVGFNAQKSTSYVQVRPVWVDAGVATRPFLINLMHSTQNLNYMGATLKSCEIDKEEREK